MLSVPLGNIPQQVDFFRHTLTGWTTIDKNFSLTPLNNGKTGNLFLDAVMNDKSKALTNYNYYQYFVEIVRVLKENVTFGCVVQDSFYKDVNLQYYNCHYKYYYH